MGLDLIAFDPKDHTEARIRGRFRLSYNETNVMWCSHLEWRDYIDEDIEPDPAPFLELDGLIRDLVVSDLDETCIPAKAVHFVLLPKDADEPALPFLDVQDAADPDVLIDATFPNGYRMELLPIPSTRDFAHQRKDHLIRFLTHARDSGWRVEAWG